jgi:hypothetical protein
MGLTAKGGNSLPPLADGLYQGICYGVIDLGTHFNEKFGKSRHEIAILWELPQVRIEVEKDGRVENLPRAISKRYTLSLNDKAILRRDLESWRGKKFTKDELKGFDVSKLVGVPCQLQIIQNEQGYSNVSAIVQAAPNQKGAKPENAAQFFSFEDWHGEPIPENIPKWAREIIVAADEYRLLSVHSQGAGQAGNGADDIPPADDVDFSDVPF